MLTNIIYNDNLSFIGKGPVMNWAGSPIDNKSNGGINENISRKNNRSRKSVY